MTYIFGPGAEHEINKAQNGLFVQGVIEEAFENHQVVIVPAEDKTQPREWMFSCSR